MLRVLIITENDPLYVARLFEVFFREYPREEFELIGLTVDRAFHEPLTRTARRVFGFYGPADFCRLCARFLIARLSGRNIQRLAHDAGVPLLPTQSVNDPAYVERVRALKPDVIFSVAAPQKFKRPLLDSARLGCFNIHSGRLPRYRGMMPSFWQMLHGESHATVTVHAMTAELDAGGIVGTLDVAIRDRDSLDRVMTEAKREGAHLMIRVLRELARGEAVIRPLVANGSAYFSFPQSGDVRAFRKRGHRLL